MNRLARLRIRERVTQSELAERLGISERDVGTLETTDLRHWDVNTIRRYLDALDFRLELLAVSDAKAVVV